MVNFIVGLIRYTYFENKPSISVGDKKMLLSALLMINKIYSHYCYVIVVELRLIVMTKVLKRLESF